MGKSLLFFGCRSSAEYIYRDELDGLVTGKGEGGGNGGNGEIEVVSAFSREGKRRYVQDSTEERAEEVCRLLSEENAYFYICGSAGMARDVKGRVEGVMKKRMGWGEQETRTWSEGLRRGRRWQEDVWG